MIIKHRPQGGTPYFVTGLERLPANPKPGDTIRVNAIIEGTGEFDATLYWICNGKNMAPLKPAYFKSRFSNGEGGSTVFKQYDFKQEDNGPDATGNPYISFTLGEFNARDIIEYWIECKAGNETLKTSHYFFEILDPVQFSSVEKINADKGMMHICFKEAEAMRLVLNIYFKDGRLHFIHGLESSVSVHCDPSLVEKTDYGYACTSVHSGNKVIVTKDPFTIKVMDKNGLVLFESDPAKPYMVLYRGRQSGIRQWDLSLKMDNDYFMGFGERFNAFNQKGLHVHNYNIEVFSEQGPVAYLPIPFFLTERQFGFHIDTTYHVDMDMGATDRDMVYFSMDTEGEHPRFDYCVYFGEPKEIIRAFTQDTGKVVMPPKWTFGLWISSNRWNNQSECIEQLSNTNKYDIPATVMVLEAWTDECTMYLLNDAQYDPVQGEYALRYEDLSFSRDSKWPDFKGLVETLHEAGVKLVLWQVPVIKDPVGKDYSPQAKKDDEAAWRKGYGVMEPDGKPHRKPFKWFGNCQVPDFTDPESAKWFLEKRRYLIDIGVDGFKTDGGEFTLDDDLRFHNGKTGREMRNLYTSLYLEAFHNFCGPERVLFSRGGYTGCQRYTLYWAGDQISTFEEMRSILRGGLSLALCGNAFWSFDISGFAGNMPSTELYIRSAQMGAFCPVMQYHSAPMGGFFGDEKALINDRTPWNVAAYNEDERALTQFRRLVNIRMNLMPYIYGEARYCSQYNEPMMRPLIIDFPKDPAVYGIDDQYMFGRELLVAPILVEGANGRDVYLPFGQWVDFFNGKEYQGGRTIRYDCGLDIFPVFIRKGAVIPLNLNKSFEIGGSIGNDINHYQKLTFMVTDSKGLPYRFSDESGNDIRIRNDGGRITIEMNGAANEIFVMSSQPLQSSGKNVHPNIWQFNA